MDFALVLRWWLAATGLAVGGALVWTLAPVLIPIALVAAGLGGVSYLAIAAARAIERRRSGAPRNE